MGPKGFHPLIKLLLGIRLRDIDCGLGLTRKGIVEDVLREAHDPTYGFRPEIPIVPNLQGIRIAEVAVSYRNRPDGNTTLCRPRRRTDPPRPDARPPSAVEAHGRHRRVVKL